MKEQGSKEQIWEENSRKDLFKGRLKFPGKALAYCWDHQSMAWLCREMNQFTETLSIVFILKLEPTEGYKRDYKAWLHTVSENKTEEVSSSPIFVIQPELDKILTVSLETI